MNKGTAIVGFLLCFISGMGAMWSIDRGGVGRSGESITAEGGAASANEAVWSNEDAAIPISSKDPSWGSPKAPVTIVIFSDFECPFCGKVEPTITQMKEKYGPDKLRVVWKNNPLPMHKNARGTSIAAEAVFRLGGSKAFWKFHGLAFANMKGQNPEAYVEWAAQSGVDKAKFKALVDKPEVAKKVDDDMAVGRAAGVSGTPASLINGVLLSGAVPPDKFSAEIDKQLKAAQDLIGKGTKPEKVYNTLVAENKAKNPAPKGRDGAEGQDDKTVWKVPLGESPQKGPATALVTIVEFSEFQCPFCTKVLPTLDALREQYGDKLRIVFKSNPLPFHPRAEPAAQLALEARAQKGDKGFWAAHDLIFKNQQKLADEDLLGYAKELGLDENKAKAAITEHKYEAEITASQDLASDLKAGGTPHFFINGRRLTGAQPIEKFKTIIDEEMKKAEGLLAKGVAAKDIYAEIIKDGKEPPPLERKEIPAPTAESPWKGGEKAKVIIHEFSDFECPFCKKVTDTVNQVAKTYGDKVKIVWRHHPLAMHKNAPLASEASQEAYKQKGKDGFWAYHDLLFKAAGTPDAFSRANLEKYAEETGLDLPKFKAALDGNVHKKFVDADNELAMKVGLTGAPAFTINGYVVSGAQPFSAFKKVIDKALKEVESGGAPKVEAPKKK